MSERSGSIGACRRTLTGVLALSMSIGCSRSEPPAMEAAHTELAPDLASATAFDLEVTSSGALLGWVSSARSTAFVARFDAGAELAGAIASWALEPDTLAGVRDLSLVDAAAGAWLAWLQVGSSGARARSASLAAARAAVAFDLGPAWAGAALEARGNLALMARGAGALVLARGEQQPCTLAPGDGCFDFQFYELSTAGVSDTGLPLSVPVPCSARAAQLLAGSARRPTADAAEPARFDYAVCTLAGAAPVLTVFSIEPDRQYAAAQQVLPGCTPLGSGRFADEAAFVSACGSDRRMASLLDADHPPRTRDINVRGLICDGEQPKLRLGNDWLGLIAPVGDLELLLDAELAPPSARVVWTGRALLVASAEHGRLVLTRYACRASRLERLDSPSLRS